MPASGVGHSHWQYQRLDGPEKTRLQRFRARNSGWRLGVLAGLCISTSVLCGNLALVFVGFRYSGYSAGIGILAQGPSTSIARISTIYHVLINALSTLLLTASNYCMQVLCSPSRDDIDRAHGEGSYVNVGTLSPWNVRFLKGFRKTGWYVLMLTSIPLHLLLVAPLFDPTPKLTPIATILQSQRSR